jgi:pimeloyl-ACP methyl ester carboxylesterase
MLAHKIIGPLADGAPIQTVYILHGLLGSARNWQSFVSTLSSRLTATEFVCLDLRNHGNSQGFPGPHTLDACVDDVLEFARATGKWPSGLVGHSMGGKILLQLASRHSEVSFLTSRQHHRPRLHLSIVDSLPGRHQAGSMTASDSVAKVLNVVSRAPRPIPSRQTVIDMCTKEGIEKGVALWLASNISHVDSAISPGCGFRWQFDPETAGSLYESYLNTDRWDVLLKGPPADVEIDAVIATRSSRWTNAETQSKLEQSEAADRIRNTSGYSMGGPVSFNKIEAGHWVHVDNPTALNHRLAETLRELR